jgi:hypothetical protein
MLVALVFGGIATVLSIDVTVKTPQTAAVGAAPSPAGNASAAAGRAQVTAKGTPAAPGGAPAAAKAAPAPAQGPPAAAKGAPAAGGAPAAAKGGAPAAAGGAPAAAGGAPTAAENEPNQLRYAARNAMRWTALLWGIACCAVGSFIGFIFGIPRSLSSDTARNTVPTEDAALVSAKSKAAASIAAFNAASREMEKAADAVREADKNLAIASAKAEHLLAEADKTQTDADARTRSVKAQQELEGIQTKKREVDLTALEKSKTVKSAQEQAQRDQDAVAAMIQARGAPQGNTQYGRGPSTAVNTNLEQISDWLTKIIVGVSLVNSENVGLAMSTAAENIALSIGGGPEKKSLALAILVYFGVTGVLGGYLLTRLFLQRAFDTAGSSEVVSP